MTLTFLHEQPVRQREYGNEDECIKTSNALLGVAHYDQWLQSPHNQHRWAMFGLYYETAVFCGSTIVYLFLSCGRDIMFFPMYCVHLYMNKHAPPVLIRHVFFHPQVSCTNEKGLKKRHLLSITYSARLNESLYVFHLCLICALTVCFVNYRWCIILVMPRGSAQCMWNGDKSLQAQCTGNKCSNRKWQHSWLKTQRYECRKFPIFNSPCKNKSTKPVWRVMVRNKQCIIYTISYWMQNEWIFNFIVPASRCWMVRKPTGREEREWERRLRGEER